MVAASLHRARFCWACRVVALEAAEPGYLHPRQLSDHCNKQVLWKKLNLLFFPRIAMTLMLILTVRSKGINHICLHTENIGTVDSKLLALMFYILIFLLFNLFFFSMRACLTEPFHSQIHSICIRALSQHRNMCICMVAVTALDVLCSPLPFFNPTWKRDVYMYVCVYMHGMNQSWPFLSQISVFLAPKKLDLCVDSVT